MATPTKTPTKPRTPARKTKAADTPAAEPTSAAAGPPAGADLSGDQDLQEAIARRAYEIYEANGRPEGRDAEHWAQAEHEVRARRGL